MQTLDLVGCFLSAARCLKPGLEHVANAALRDTYHAAKAALQQRLRGSAAQALELAAENPASPAREQLLREETAALGLAKDRELVLLAEQLAQLLPPESRAYPTISVHGNRNTVQAAGRDLIWTERVIRENRITPDERHLSADQHAVIDSLLREITHGLSGRARKSRFAALHTQLQKRYRVSSYLLIPRDDYESACSWLRQVRASGRSIWLERDPHRYRSSLYRSIFATARELKWSSIELLRFTAERLQLGPVLRTIKHLSPAQLNSLRIILQREAEKRRSASDEPSSR